MGLFDDLLGNVEKKISKYQTDLDESYSNNSERYADMSDERLRREIQRLRDMNGYDANRMGKIAAMKEELERRG